ncbi:MAG: cytochrome c biogenesis protein DipZ [Sphaerochaetaceae bacterium]
MALLAFFAFLSGIVTILSPCILPVLPIVLTGSIGGKRKPFGVVVGFIASFSVFTLALSAIVQVLGIPADTLRIVAVVIITMFGLALVIPKLYMLFEIALSRMIRTKGSSERKGFIGGLLTGVSLGLVWTPCVGPIMASVISLAVSQQVDGGAVLIVAAYSLGTSIPMFALMAGGRKLLNRFPRLSMKTAAIQRIFGLIMIVTGLMIAVGADRRFQTLVLEAFPQYGSGLTTFENTEVVRNALDKRSGDSVKGNLFVWGDAPENAQLEDFGMAPPLVAGGPWINTDAPITMEALRGKVVLVDFWTYSCVNCVRTLPYLRDWYDAYSDKGLEILGIHSPEFPFERNINNVRKAVEELNVTWPVVLDNDFAQWNVYNNRFWPAHFFIDSKGVIRYFHFGEGSYEESEEVIRKLLKEAGADLTESRESFVSENFGKRTPETYLGYARQESLVPENAPHDQLMQFQFADALQSGEWSLDGEWIIRNDFIEIDGFGGLELSFEGKDIYLVAEPLDENSSIDVEIDGMPGRDTADVKDGVLKPQESRLYHLSSFEESSEHMLKLKIEGQVRLYTFTFG